MKKVASKAAKLAITEQTFSFPILIMNGIISQPLDQNGLAEFYDFVEQFDDVALQANMEITIFAKSN